MALTFNTHHIEHKPLRLKGELSQEELDLQIMDELIQAPGPLSYDLVAEHIEQGILVQGTLELVLECDCARCLRHFKLPLRMENWACHLPTVGEEKVEIINDLVDLTPHIREDILLAFPQHPLCEPDCKGLAAPQQSTKGSGDWKSQSTSSVWSELDKLNDLNK